nr:hypothetical protein [Corynebacterium xerosis]
MLADGIVAHAHDAMVEVRDDRLRVVRLAATDEDGPVVILDVARRGAAHGVVGQNGAGRDGR